MRSARSPSAPALNRTSIRRVASSALVGNPAPVLLRGRLLATALLALGLGLLGAPGCYYGHLASGQLELMLAREPVERILEDPATPARLREQLELVAETRAFATQLGLEVGGRYTSYVDWPGDRIVTTVVATRPGEVEPAGFRFPIIGRVPYKGFFDPEAAEHEAERLRATDHDVCVVPVAAYSTLGWVDDPLTAPMLRRKDPALVETVIHELVHANVYLRDHPQFNEGVARFIGQEAAVRFFGGAPEVRLAVTDSRTVAGALLVFRERVASLYAEQQGAEARATARSALESRAREAIAALPLETRDPVQLADAVRLNDACLALQGTYAADTPEHIRVLEALQGDLGAFVARLLEAADGADPRARFFEPTGPTEAATQ